MPTIVQGTCSGGTSGGTDTGTCGGMGGGASTMHAVGGIAAPLYCSCCSWHGCAALAIARCSSAVPCSKHRAPAHATKARGVAPTNHSTVAASFTPLPYPCPNPHPHPAARLLAQTNSSGIKNGLTSASTGAVQQLDIIGFDACLMGMAEIASMLQVGGSYSGARGGDNTCGLCCQLYLQARQKH